MSRTRFDQGSEYIYRNLLSFTDAYRLCEATIICAISLQIFVFFFVYFLEATHVSFKARLIIVDPVLDFSIIC